MSLKAFLCKLLPWPTEVIKIVDMYAKLQFTNETVMSPVIIKKYKYNSDTYHIKNDCLFKNEIMYFQCFDFSMCVINNTMCIVVKTNYSSNKASIYTIDNKLLSTFTFKNHIYNVLYGNNLIIEYDGCIQTYGIRPNFKSLCKYKTIKTKW